MAFIDTDEFLVPIEQKCLPRLLEDYERFPGVLVCWVFFGSNGHIFQSPDWILTSHPGHGSQASKRYKTIAQPAKLKSASRTSILSIYHVLVTHVLAAYCFCFVQLHMQ
jgi:hypothetical protein